MRSLDSMLDELDAPLVRQPRLADTIPPTEPPAPVALAKPRRHDVVAWRQDGGPVQWWRHETLELAREFAHGLHYATYWKYAITCGRETVERALIEELGPVSL